MVEYSDSQAALMTACHRSLQGCQDSALGLCLKFAGCDFAADRVSPGGEACDVALLSCRKNCFVAAALFMTFRAFAEIIIIVGREEASSVLCLSVMYLFNGFRAKLSSTPNYPQSIHPERQTWPEE